MGRSPAELPLKPTYFQRRSLKSLAKFARKRPGEPLSEDDWAAYWAFGSQPTSRALKSMLRALPSTPRCGFCGAPFGGLGKHVVAPLGYRPSRKNPNICSVCVELAPPGGMTIEAGVLFVDLRGFTTLTEQLPPAQASALLQRFYACAEKTLLPKAIIDKMIGDEVMALYLPPFMIGDRDRWELDEADRAAIATTMIGHARELLARIGYGTPVGPFAEAGVGLDYGEVFVGNVGQEAVRDFTAIGDVVNTASRLQGHAGSGEILISDRLARHLDDPPGRVEELTVKGKANPVRAYRLRWADEFVS
jgi:adenylate cyclase